MRGFAVVATHAQSRVAAILPIRLIPRRTCSATPLLLLLLPLQHASHGFVESVVGYSQPVSGLMRLPINVGRVVKSCWHWKGRGLSLSVDMKFVFRGLSSARCAVFLQFSRAQVFEDSGSGVGVLLPFCVRGRDGYC
uniref:Uncharacterized protein n=1 Tax=Physcomitrium patens TaxID=3218 RepID=A0A2K1KXM2_PHYPA|nr:hypothetical protein PHYPA_005495 [Physcomitrium patens]